MKNKGKQEKRARKLYIQETIERCKSKHFIDTYTTFISNTEQKKQIETMPFWNSLLKDNPDFNLLNIATKTQLELLYKVAKVIQYVNEFPFRAIGPDLFNGLSPAPRESEAYEIY